MKENLKKIWNILNDNQKKQFYFLIILLILGTFFELLSIGLVFPVVSILFDVGNQSTQFLKKLFNLFSNDISQDKMVLISLSLLVIIYLIKNLVLTIIAKIEVSKIVKIKFEIADSLYRKFITNPYRFHLNNNSSNLINFTTNQIDSFSNSMFNCVILAAEILIILGVISVLFFTEPGGTTIIALLASIFGLTFYKVMKKRISKLSQEMSDNRSYKIKNLQESFGSIKEIKIYNKEKYFFNLFNIYNKKVVDIEGYETFLKRLPRLWFEFLCVLIFVTFLIFTISLSNIDIINLTPILGLFGVATIRLIPSINRILLAIQTINFGEAALIMLDQNLNSIQQPRKVNNISPNKNKFTKNLTFENVSFSFNKEKKIVDNINLNIERGDFVGFFGETGVGKTTLLNILLGLIKPTFGKIKIDGENIENDLAQWQSKIGFVPQSIYLLDDTIIKNIAFGVSDIEIDHEKMKSIIRDSQLEKFVLNLPKKENNLVGERGMQISGGQLQRIGIARALYINPEILIFDESTSSLDNETELKIMETIKNVKKDKTVIFVSHKKTPMKFCNKLFEIKKSGVILRDKL
tara:strand:+ start:669 stop:2402 length:1734 start_codon:yes stop_codon:yes gene_type:complete